MIGQLHARSESGAVPAAAPCQHAPTRQRVAKLPWMCLKAVRSWRELLVSSLGKETTQPAGLLVLEGCQCLRNGSHWVAWALLNTQLLVSLLCTLMPAPADADAPAPLVLPATGGATRLRQELLSRSCFCCRWQSPNRPGLRSVGTYCGVLQPMKRLLMSRNSRQERFLVHPCRP